MNGVSSFGDRGRGRNSKIRSRKPRDSKALSLGNRHDNEYYIGALMFDDAKFCWMVSTALQYHHIGRSIKEIGDLDFSYTLQFHNLSVH
jgi:hypothetical protein